MFEGGNRRQVLESLVCQRTGQTYSEQGRKSLDNLIWKLKLGENVSILTFQARSW